MVDAARFRSLIYEFPVAIVNAAQRCTLDPPVNDS
jgi:hypothetical protein